MGRLEEVLAAVDNARRVVGRNASDLFSDPAGHLTKLTDALRNTNASVAPVISNGELTKRPLSPAEQTEQTLGSLDFGGGLGVIKPKGGNWLSGQVEDVLRGLKRGGDVALDGPVRPEIKALNQWIEGPLTNYVKRDMGAPNDPIRKLADQGVQFAEATDIPEPSKILRARRTNAGFPAEGTAQTDMGRAWENALDTAVISRPASEFQLPNNLAKDPWLATVPPDTPIRSLAGHVNSTVNFNHLIDELSNSLREGRLRPEQLQSGNFSVDAAVRHVAEINALRAKKAQEALAADMEGMPLHKDYPEAGMSWRQLKQTGDQNAWQAQFDARKAELLAESKAQNKKWARGSLDEKIRSELGESPDNTLQKWLTQEGDAMGHCVGGYCPDVKSGASSIYSLRDAKGQPHVTIETTPGRDYEDLLDDAINAVPADLRVGTQEYNDFIDAEMDYLRENLAKTTPPKITQIKGKGNAKPADQYLPFVQDFIRSGKWSDIGDAGNTGLTPEEINQLLGR